MKLPTNIESYATCRVKWFGRGSKLTTLAEKVYQSDESTSADLMTGGYSDIAAMSWTKDLTSPAGVLNLTLFPRKDYVRLMAPEDVLLVYGKSDKTSPEKLIALVSVDSVREQRMVEDGATVVRHSVSGRDLGKILMETPTVYDAAFGGITSARFWEQFVGGFTEGKAQGGPSLVVQTMLSVFFNLQQSFTTIGAGAFSPLKPWLIPGTDQPLFQVIDLKSFVQVPMVGSLDTNPSLLQNAANLWSLCDMYANRVVNEFFIDVRDLVVGYDAAHKRMGELARDYLNGVSPSSAEEQEAGIERVTREMSLDALAEADFADLQYSEVQQRVAIVHRQMPYDTESFYALPTTVVYSTECFSSDIGYASHDIVNMFRMRVPGVIEGVAQDLQFGVHINRDSIEQHGLRRYEGETIYAWTDTTDGLDYALAYKFFTALVTTWHAYNERLKAGTLSTRYRPDIRVGTRLTYVKKNGETTIVEDYYVQQVSHNFSPEPNASRTSLQLVRGVERTGLTVEPYRESHLFIDSNGKNLDPDPYEVVISEDLLTDEFNL